MQKYIPYLFPCQWQPISLLLSGRTDKSSNLSLLSEQCIKYIAKIFLDFFPKPTFVKEHRYTVYPHGECMLQFPQHFWDDAELLSHYAQIGNQNKAQKIVLKNGRQIINFGCYRITPIVPLVRK